MSPPSDMSPANALQAQAVGWLVRVQSDTATADDWAALTAWLETSEAHVEAFARAERLSFEIDDNAARIAARTPPARPAEILPLLRRAKPVRRWAPTAAAAAAVALIVGITAFERAYDGQATVYRTGVGETREIALTDGSRIHLDAASTLTVRLGWRRRRVDLAQSQASFDVAKDAGRPFIVSVGDQQVRVVGTEFNISHADRTVVVTVRRGVVEVRQPDLDANPVARLTRGDELRHAEGAATSRLTRVDPEKAFAWTTERLMFEDEPLSQIVAKLNRRYPIPIRLSKAAAAKRFSGVLELGDQTALVRRLADYLSLTVRRTDREIILS